MRVAAREATLILSLIDLPLPHLSSRHTLTPSPFSSLVDQVIPRSSNLSASFKPPTQKVNISPLRPSPKTWPFEVNVRIESDDGLHEV